MMNNNKYNHYMKIIGYKMLKQDKCLLITIIINIMERILVMQILILILINQYLWKMLMNIIKMDKKIKIF